MKSVICKINNLETSKKQEGRLFSQEDNWGFDKLIAWVYRNCQPAEIKIIPEKEVIAIFDDRVETYYFKKEENKNETNNL